MAEQPVLQANNWNPGRPTTYKVWIDFRNKLKNRVEILEATFSQLQKTFWTAVMSVMPSISSDHQPRKFTIG